MFKYIGSFWKGNDKKHGNQYLTTTVVASLLGTVLKNTWLFTATPMVDECTSNPTTKFFHMLGLIIANVGLNSFAAIVTDRLRFDYAQTHLTTNNLAKKTWGIYDYKCTCIALLLAIEYVLVDYSFLYSKTPSCQNNINNTSIDTESADMTLKILQLLGIILLDMAARIPAGVAADLVVKDYAEKNGYTPF